MITVICASILRYKNKLSEDMYIAACLCGLFEVMIVSIPIMVILE